MNRPFTTLFMIQSLDGKISTGDVDELDVDKDFKRIAGVREGLHQYYDLEKQIDPFSLNTGRVMAKIGVNERNEEPVKIECSFIIIDSKPHLSLKGTEYIAKWVKRLFLVTSNPHHPAFKLSEQYPNIEILFYEQEVNLKDLLKKLKHNYHIERLTIQSGGTLNAAWIRSSLIDQVSVVIAPCLIGGATTQSLVGGESLHTQEDLLKIRALTLVQCNVLNNNYIHLIYEVDNSHSPPL
jgi:2,5-diamino-6-(ribosylamino)-4(3H)-pyrimidinone 5'-phosphate reductase